MNDLFDIFKTILSISYKITITNKILLFIYYLQNHIKKNAMLANPVPGLIFVVEIFVFKHSHSVPSNELILHWKLHSFMLKHVMRAKAGKMHL